MIDSHTIVFVIIITIVIAICISIFFWASKKNVVKKHYDKKEIFPSIEQEQWFNNYNAAYKKQCFEGYVSKQRYYNVLPDEYCCWFGITPSTSTSISNYTIISVFSESFDGPFSAQSVILSQLLCKLLAISSIDSVSISELRQLAEKKIQDEAKMEAIAFFKDKIQEHNIKILPALQTYWERNSR